MDETRILALRALRDLLDDAGPDDWDDLVACYRALRKAIAKNKPMTRKDRARVAEHLRGLGWREGTIGAATTWNLLAGPSQNRGMVKSLRL